MNFNFDNFRKQTVEYFNEIVDIINSSNNEDGNLIIQDIDSLNDAMKGLRQKIVILTCIEDEKENIHCLNIDVKKIKI